MREAPPAAGQKGVQCWTKAGQKPGRSKVRKWGSNWTKPADAGRKNDSAKTKGIKAAPFEIQKRNTGREKTSRHRTAIDSEKEKIPAYDRHRKEAGAEMIAAPGKGGIHADDRVGNGGISGRSRKPEKCKSRSGSGAESAGTGTIAEP